MSGKGSSSLKELKTLREAVLAEEKARTHALLQHLPMGQAELARNELEAANEAAEDQGADILPMPLPMSAAPVKPAAAPGAPARSAPSSPVPRVKTSKEPALIIPLTPKIQERLQRNVENARWSPAELVIELIRASLHRGYAEIKFGDQIIAKGGTYRTFERNPFETSFKVVSGQGVFSVSVNSDGEDYKKWLSHFLEEASGDPTKSASQVCLFELQSYLESIDDFKPDGWTKSIPVEGYTLSRVV